MTNRIQTLRSSVAGNVPVSGSRQPGELWLNFADSQLGYIDASKVAQKFLPVRFFSALASYAAGDMVSYSGVLYAANAAIPPGPFNVSQWTLIGGAGVGYLPLSGGSLSGPLTLSSGSITVSNGNISASGSGTGNISGTGTGTFGSITTAGALNVTGTAATGALTVTGNLSATGTATFGSTLTLNNGGVISKGASAGFFAYDEGGSGGDTTKYFALYRNGNLGGLTMQEAGGPVLNFATSGAATFLSSVAITNGGFYSYGSNGVFASYDRNGNGQNMVFYRSANVGYIALSDVGNLITLTGSVNLNVATYVNNALTVSSGTTCNGSTPLTSNGNGNNYPLIMNSPSSQHCLVSHTVTGVRQWLTGAWNNGSYYMYDASSGRVAFSIDTNGGTTLGGGNGYAWVGANAWWQGSGAFEVSPRSGGVGAFEVYGGSSSGGWAIYSRTDAWTTYNMVLLQGTTVNGSITTNGSNAFFNTSCDGRRKENIRSLVSEIDVGSIIDALKPVAFEWKPVEFETLDEPADEDVTLADGTVFKGKPEVKGKRVRIAARTDHGFVAQDLYQVLPGIVHKPEKEDLPMMADYSKIVPYLVAELQALRKRVAQLEAA